MLKPIVKNPIERATDFGSLEVNSRQPANGGNGVMDALLPADESARIEALCASQLLDTDAEAAFDDIAHLAATLCDTPMALVSLVDRDRQWFKSRVGVELKQTPRRQSFCAHAILSPADVFVVPDAKDDIRFHDNPLVTGDTGARFYAGVALHGPSGHALGTLCVLDSKPRTFTDEQKQHLQRLGVQLEQQLQLREMLWQKELLLKEKDYYQRQLEHANERLEKQSVTDALTGLHNRRDLDQRIREEIERATRHNTPLSLAVIDVDGFKGFNDRFGHLAGDAILRRISRLLQQNSRTEDYLARHGGDEFMVILPDTDLKGAKQVMQRFCDLVNDYAWKMKQVTVSVGLAELDGESHDRRGLVEAADQALYHSKRAGRNRVSTI